MLGLWLQNLAKCSLTQEAGQTVQEIRGGGGGTERKGKEKQQIKSIRVDL